MAKQQYTRRTANNLATKRLVEEHYDRYRELQREEYEKAGLELPETEREKAQRQLEELVTKFPDLVTGLRLEVPDQPAQAAAGDAPPPDPADEDVADDGELPEGHNFFGDQNL